jgi:catechol-2,3-dioxygenase
VRTRVNAKRYASSKENDWEWKENTCQGHPSRSNLEPLADLPENYRNWTFRIESVSLGVVLLVTEDTFQMKPNERVPRNFRRVS